MSRFKEALSVTALIAVLTVFTALSFEVSDKIEAHREAKLLEEQTLLEQSPDWQK
jgi:hypothetical protein